MTDKVKENYFRRKAKRLGLTLHKTRAREWSIDNRLGYQLLDAETGDVLRGERFEITLEDLEEILNEYEKRLRQEDHQ